MSIEEITNSCRIFIPGNVPSSKNSKQWTGKFLVHSKTVKKYLKGFGYAWNEPATKEVFSEEIEGLEPPYKIGFYFVRDTRRKFDYINALQLPQDLMVEFGWLEDDNNTILIPVVLGSHVDKNNAGVYIKVLKD